MIPKNIFFYWDSDDIPMDVINNVNNYKIHNSDFNVKLLCNDDINKYKDNFPKLIELFHLSTIAALRADIIRLIFLYEEGGMWIDANTTLTNPDGIKLLFDTYQSFDFVSNYFPSHNDLSTSALISKPKSALAYDTILIMTDNLTTHYEHERQNECYIPYNMFMFVAPVVFYTLLDHIPNKSSNDLNIILASDKFKKYNCGLMDVTNILAFWSTNMNHHHGENMHKHWSRIQDSQKLFKT
jgi:hypothetical protein